MSAPVEVCQIDGLVLLKMIKHCKENVPEAVTGQLLGLDVEGRLEVTNCFPLPADDDDDQQYQLEMMKNLRKVNVDSHVVGWYQSAFLGSFLDKEILKAQFEYQKSIPNSVVIVYDPFRTTNGNLALKAYRLSDEFMHMYGTEAFTSKEHARADLSDTTIFQEIPLKVHNSHLVHGYLYELREDKSMSCEADRLNMFANPFLQKNLEIMSSCIDEYTQEQGKFQFHQRQAARNRTSQENYRKSHPELSEEQLKKLPMFRDNQEPSRLDSFIITNQMTQYADHINSISNSAFSKLYVADALKHVEGPLAVHEPAEL